MSICFFFTIFKFSLFEVFFNFVGKYIPSHFGEAKLTPEKAGKITQER